MRTQNCREKIHKTAELCHLSPETVAEIDRVTGFVKDNPSICGLSTDAIKPLMAISDPEKQQEAISIVEKSLNRKTPTGGIIKKTFTKPEVKKIVEKVVPTEKPKKPLTRPEPGDKNYGQYCAQPGSLPPESDAPIPAPLSEKLKEPAAKPATPYTTDAIRQSAKDRINRMDQYAVAFINELSPAKQMAIEEYQRTHLEYQTMADLVVVAIDQMITSKK
jgi:hypothetical protein